MSVNVKQNGALTKVGGLYKESTPMSVAEYYSTDEHKVGVNTDGKPLYQKTYIWQGEIAPNGYTALDANFLSTSVDDFLLVNSEYRVSSTTGGELLANIFTNSVGGKIAEVTINTANGLYIENRTSMYIRQAKVTVQYTKTTDNVTGGIYAPIIPMQMASKYSTDEKVVGQWTDGKPLYQRTILKTGVSISPSQTYDIETLTDIDTLMVIHARIIEGGITYTLLDDSARRLKYTDSTGKLQLTGVPSGTSWVDVDLYVTIQYTKTTDTANTGLYSDDEATLEMLGDVNITDLQDGDGIKWDDTAKKWINGEVGGGGTGGGVGYIDFTNVLYESGQISSNLSSYSKTVTEDCWMQGVIKGNGSQSAQIFVNGEIAGANMSAYDISCLMPVRSGDVITLRDLSNVYYHVNLYGYTGANAIDIASMYSTEEREIGCWTDGKPLYQKTIKVPASSLTSSETTLSHGLTNVENIYEIEGIALKTGNGTTPLLTYHSSSVWACGIYNVSRTSYTFYAGSSLKPYITELEITFKYTKTTDVAGSGRWTPNGNYAEHYSEQEQVVGTWIDGKTLYRKVVKYTGTYYGEASVSLDTGLTNVSEILPTTSVNAITNTDAPMPLPYSHSNANNNIGYFISSDFTKLNLRMGTGYTSSNYLKQIIAIYEYTKTSSS